jgi:hypothetical protein
MSALSFPILTAERYQAATNRAKALIRERVEAPEWAHFQRAGTQVYPRWFTWLILVALVGVMVFSFTISTGNALALGAGATPILSLQWACCVTRQQRACGRSGRVCVLGDAFQVGHNRHWVDGFE